MSYRTNLDVIAAQAGPLPEGPAPEELRAYAIWQGYLHDGALKSGIGIDQVVRDLKRDFDLAPV